MFLGTAHRGHRSISRQPGLRRTRECLLVCLSLTPDDCGCQMLTAFRRDCVLEQAVAQYDGCCPGTDALQEQGPQLSHICCLRWLLLASVSTSILAASLLLLCVLSLVRLSLAGPQVAMLPEVVLLPQLHTCMWLGIRACTD